MIQGGRDSAGGGSDAELQTDVMRFFAILAICVIALTSLVETVNRSTAESSRPEPAAPQRRAAEVVTPQAAPRDAGSRRAPAETAEPREPPEASAPVPPSNPPPESAPRAAAHAKPATQPGSEVQSLRFASPQALLRLVSGGQVRVFAAVSGRGYRLTPDGRRFVPASLPPALYLMAPETIPEDFPRTLAREAGGAPGVIWGVTLSAAIRRRLAEAVNAGAGSLLLIDAAGRVAAAESGS